MKPRRIIEIGSGFSTLVAIKAIQRNREQLPDYQCEHICVEPYEAHYLESKDVTVIRQRVEDTDVCLFRKLQADDILFIDSSHVIRPQGDIVFEYLELLPILNPGVVVHVHDIFSPKNYPKEWLDDEIRLWNEQYLLEAFLTHNSDWEIIGALNFLLHHHFLKLKAACPSQVTPERGAGSFYIRRTHSPKRVWGDAA